jgi:transcriptional regulator with XRE-family HTH domain
MSISPAQMRMARAALRLTTRKMGEALELSAMSISRYEKGDESVISIETAKRIKEWLYQKRIYLGPGDGVCLNQDIFKQERWMATACCRLMHEHGIHPSSQDLIDANKREAGER